MSFLNRVFGDPNERELKRIRPIVDHVNFDGASALGHHDPNDGLQRFRARLPPRWQLDAVVDGVAEHMHERIPEEFQDLAIDLGVPALKL